jgi:vacuolar-type H+-ATPase subunit I/STV1
MGISVSLLLAAVGAALIWAVNATVSGMNIHTVGVILLIVGFVGFATSIFFWSSWGGFSARGTPVATGTTTTTRDRVVEQ